MFRSIKSEERFLQSLGLTELERLLEDSEGSRFVVLCMRIVNDVMEKCCPAIGFILKSSQFLVNQRIVRKLNDRQDMSHCMEVPVWLRIPLSDLTQCAVADEWGKHSTIIGIHLVRQ